MNVMLFVCCKNENKRRDGGKGGKEREESLKGVKTLVGWMKGRKGREKVRGRKREENEITR